MPDVLPSCFGDPHASHAFDAFGDVRSAHNLVTCLYKTKLAGKYRLISITWCKTLMGQVLSVHVDVDDPTCQLICNVDMKPWHFWKKHGCKTFELAGVKVDVMWDLSSAKYVSGPEPNEGYFVAILCDQNVVLFLGDIQRAPLKNAYSEPTTATLLSRREHVCGKQLYSTRAQFCESGQTHDIVIECHTGSGKEPRLSVRVDKQVVLQVKRLMWKFRGNQTILIDDLPIMVFWDVHNWLFNSGDGAAHAVFMFQTCSASEKPWSRQVSTTLLRDSMGSSKGVKDMKKHSHQEGVHNSVLHWPNSNSFKNKEQHDGSFGFSLVLYAWKNE